jgi:hypothetical protein
MAACDKEAGSMKRGAIDKALRWSGACLAKMETKKLVEKSKTEDLLRARAQPAWTASNDIESTP